MSLETDVQKARDAITVMKNWKRDVDGWNATYEGQHSTELCEDGSLVDLGSDITTARSNITTIVTKAEKYLDDTEWISMLRLKANTWANAYTEAETASDAVQKQKLHADSSWVGATGNAYREAGIDQRFCITRAMSVAEVMKAGCGKAATKGEDFFAELASDLKTCADALATESEFPEWSGEMEANPNYNPNAVDKTTVDNASPERRKANSCRTHLAKAGSEATETCLTQIGWAETTLQTAFGNAFEQLPPGSPVGATRSVSDIAGTWDKAPGAG